MRRVNFLECRKQVVTSERIESERYVSQCDVVEKKMKTDGDVHKDVLVLSTLIRIHACLFDEVTHATFRHTMQSSLT